MRYDLNGIKYNLEALQTECHSVHIDIKAPRIKEYQNVSILPGKFLQSGGVYKDGKPINGTALIRGWSKDTVADSTVTIDYPIRDHVFYLGMLHSCWGHAITDCLKFVWPLLEGECLFSSKDDLHFVYTTTSPDISLPSNLVLTFKKLGIDILKAKCITTPTKFKSLIVPDESFYLIEESKSRIRHYTQAFKHTLETIIGHEKLPATRRIYFSRNGWSRNEFGEHLIELEFSKAGFEIVHPETLPLDELIKLEQQCCTLAATEGSCAHNAIFLPKNANLIIIRKANYINGYQFAINEIRNLSVAYVDAHTSIMASRQFPWGGPFFLYVSKQLATILGTKYHFPLSIFLQYVLVSLYEKAIQRLSSVKHICLARL